MSNKYKDAAKLYQSLYPQQNFYKLSPVTQDRYLAVAKELKNGKFY